MTLSLRGPTLEELSGLPEKLSRPPPLTSLRGELYDVERTTNPHGVSRRKPSAAQAAGLRYERKAKAMLAVNFPLTFIDGPWFSYRRLRDHTKRFCQPDGIASSSSTLEIFEIKLCWCREAASQLFLYRDVLRALYPGAAQRLVCVTQSFDPAVQHEADSISFIDSLEPSRSDSAAFSHSFPKRSLVEVFIWKP